MTIAGTSVAAAVANTTAQAQEVTRQRDRTAAQAIRDADRLHELVQAHMDALEEGEELQSSDEVRISDHSQQHQSPQQETPEQHAENHRAPTAGSIIAAPEPSAGAALHRHVDVQA